MSDDLSLDIKGKISEDLNSAVDLLAEKLGVDRPGGPQAFYTLCKRNNLDFRMNYPDDEFTVWYKLPEDVTTEDDIPVKETVSETKEVDENAQDDAFDFLDA